MLADFIVIFVLSFSSLLAKAFRLRESEAFGVPHLVTVD